MTRPDIEQPDQTLLSKNQEFGHEELTQLWKTDGLHLETGWWGQPVLSMVSALTYTYNNIPVKTEVFQSLWANSVKFPGQVNFNVPRYLLFLVFCL